jgi:hypothetical protein
VDWDGAREKTHRKNLVQAPHGGRAAGKAWEQQPPDAIIHNLCSPVKLSDHDLLPVSLATYHSAVLLLAGASSSAILVALRSASLDVSSLMAFCGPILTSFTGLYCLLMAW